MSSLRQQRESASVNPNCEYTGPRVPSGASFAENDYRKSMVPCFVDEIMNRSHPQRNTDENSWANRGLQLAS